MLDNDKAVKLYQAISEDNKPRVYERWHASAIPECPRAHYFKRLGIPPLNTPSAAKIIRWSAGHHLETSIRPFVEKVWGKTESNRRLTSEKLDLTGEFDNLFIDGDRLVEIKSVHDYAFIDRNGVVTLKEETGELNRWKRPEYRPKLTPNLHHELQNHAYDLLLREEGTEIKGIDYVYISLSGRIVVYKTDIQEKLTQNVLARLKVLNAAWKAQEPPACICVPEHELYGPVMQWCDYRTDEGCCAIELIRGKK